MKKSILIKEFPDDVFHNSKDYDDISALCYDAALNFINFVSKDWENMFLNLLNCI